MAITSRSDLKDYCLRRLGSPVIQINVDNGQLEDRMDDALEYFKEYHSDGIEKVYKVLTLTQDDINAKEVALNDPLIYTVNKIVSMNNGGDVEAGFSLEHQFVLSELASFNSLDTVSYYLMNEKLGNIDRLFSSGKRLEYNRYKNQIKLYVDWSTVVANETKIVVECYRFIDEETHVEIFNDRWLKQYTTALFKKQWGENLKKLKNVQLPGGVNIPGQEIYDEAVEEVRKLEEEMINWYSDPVDFMIG